MKMHPEAVNNYVAKLKELSAKLIEQFGSMTLTDEVRLQLAEITRKILKHPDWRQKISEDSLYGKLQELVLNHRNDDKFDIAKEFQEYVSRCEMYSDEWHVFIPITGIDVRSDLRIGNIVLKKLSEDESTKLQGLAKKLTQYQPLYDHVMSALHSYSLSEFIAIAEEDRAIERAIEETRRVIDILRFGAASDYPKMRPRHTIGLIGETATSVLNPIILWNPQDSRLTSNFTRKGNPIFYVIDDASIQKMKDEGLLDLGDILVKEPSQVTDLENVILSALHWYSVAQNQIEIENQFMNLMITIETALTPKDNSPVSTNVAEGLAILVGADQDERKAIRTDFLRLYRKRSGVSHHGAGKVTESDVSLLEYFAEELIRKIIDFRQRLKMESQQDLFNWILDQKFAGPPQQ